MNFTDKTECKFKRIYPKLYDSGNGLIACVTDISGRKYVTLFHKLSGHLVIDFDTHPVKSVKELLSLVEDLFKDYNFLVAFPIIRDFIEKNEDVRDRIWDGISKIRTTMYIKDHK